MSSYKHAYAERNDAARNASPKKRSGWNPNWKKTAPIVRGSAYKPIANPSEQQSAIFQDVGSNVSHLIVQALAGTGKTTTIVEAMRHVAQGKTLLYLIFAARNAREAESKVEERVECRTCHAFGLNVLKKTYGRVEVDAHGEKSRNIAQALLGPEDEKIELRYFFCKAMSLAKGYLCETVEDVLTACDKHEIEYGDMNEEEFAAQVLKGLDLSAQQYMRVEFDDMIWLVVKKNLAVPQFDYVFLDESQDLSPARIELALRAVKTGGKVVSVGDSHQAIFGFTGADEHAMQTIGERLNAHTLPLTMTYRCGKNIVALAQQYVPEYEAAHSNPDGEVVERTEDDMLKSPEDGGVAPGDFVISRVNAPLVGYCLELIKQGRKASVLGKDLGKNLTYMIKRSNATSVGGFLEWLDGWKNTECERLISRNKSCDHIVDKAECLEVMCSGRNSLEDVKRHIEDMFSDEDEGAKVVFCTAHKAKGLERDRVWLLQHTFKCKGSQEENVMYVAITRARNSLYLVSK